MSFLGVLDDEIFCIKKEKIIAQKIDAPKIIPKNKVLCTISKKLNQHKLSWNYSKAWIELTNKCNLTCAHCCSESSPSNNTFLSLHEIRSDILDLLCLCQIKKLWLSGGEPTLHPQFNEIIKILKNSIPDITVITNGSFLNSKKIAKTLVDLNISCQLSTEGITLKEITSIRGSENAEVIKKNLQNAREILPSNHLTLNYVLTKNNCNNLEKICNFVLKHKYDSLIFTFFKPIGRGELNQKLRIPLTKRIELFKAILKLKNTMSFDIHLSGGVFDHMDSIENKELKTKYNCILCTEEIQIMSDGMVSLCPGLPKNSRKKASELVQYKITNTPSIKLKGKTRCNLF